MADQTNAPDMSKVETESLDPALCRLERVQDPALIVIFGATGDLTWRKLFPSLFALYQNKLLPENVSIVGTGRSQLSHDDFRESMHRSMEPETAREPPEWDALSQRLFYHPVSYDQKESFTSLKSFLDELDATFATRGNRLFYLAVPPSVYPEIAHQLGRAGLAKEGSERVWVRFVVEKPFKIEWGTTSTLIVGAGLGVFCHASARGCPLHPASLSSSYSPDSESPAPGYSFEYPRLNAATVQPHEVIASIQGRSDDRIVILKPGQCRLQIPRRQMGKIASCQTTLENPCAKAVSKDYGSSQVEVRISRMSRK
jgi:hypothetical protein